MEAAQFFTRQRNVFALATLCCLLWGSAFPAVKLGYTLFAIAKNDLASQLLFAGYRFLFAGLILLGIAFVSGKPLVRIPPGSWRRLWLLGFTQTTLQYVFFYTGLAHASGVKSAILNAVGTFFSVLLAHWIFHNDRLTLRKTLGCSLGFVGVMVVNLGGGGLAGWGFDFTLLGEGCIVMAAFVLSCASIYGKRVSQTMDSVVMTGYQLCMGGLILMGLGLGGGGALDQITFESGALLAYLAALSAAAFSVWSMLLKYNRVSTVTVFNFLIPIFGASLSALFLQESLLAWKNLLALVLVCLGIWAVTQDKAQRTRPRG
nr:DMT family transporter [Rhodoferax aquaticus]